MGRGMAENIVRRAFRGMRQDPKRTIPFLEALDKYGLPRSESHDPVLVD